MMWVKSPWVVRVLPFTFYILVMMISAFLSDRGVDVRWLYALRAGGTALFIAWQWREYSELTSADFPSLKNILLSVSAGLLVFVLWINLDWGWMIAGKGAGYAPTLKNGDLDWGMVVMRWAGAALVVPVMEELFWRSFLMRWIDQQDFIALSPASVSVKALLLSSLLFASEHSLWFAGLVAGFIYAWLYMKTRNLWVPVLAHMVTNGVLGGWVIYSHSWSFW